MFDFSENKRKKKRRKKKTPTGDEENFLGEYVLVYSATENKIGKHIEKVLKCEPFTRESENEPTGLIWITDKCKKSTDEISNKRPEESDKETGETHAKTKWSFGSDDFITVSDEGTAKSAAQKKKLDIYDYNEIKPLEALGKRLVSAILFSDREKKMDSQLPVLIGLLKKMFPSIGIAAEYVDPKYEECYLEAGADEVFSREVLKNQTMALNILNCKVTGAIEKICRKTNDAFGSSEAPQFLGQLGLKKDKAELGMRSAYVQALRLSLKKYEYFLLDNGNWETFRKAANEVKLYPLSFFSSDPREKRYMPKGLRIKERVVLTSGDSILFLTHSGVTLRKFGEAVLKPPYLKDRRKE